MRLLLAEDDEELVATLKKELETAGYAVDVATDGVEAEYLGNEPIYDIAVLDLGLPERDLSEPRSRAGAGPVPGNHRMHHRERAAGQFPRAPLCGAGRPTPRGFRGDEARRVR